MTSTASDEPYIYIYQTARDHIFIVARYIGWISQAEESDHRTIPHRYVLNFAENQQPTRLYMIYDPLRGFWYGSPYSFARVNRLVGETGETSEKIEHNTTTLNKLRAELLAKRIPVVCGQIFPEDFPADIRTYFMILLATTY